MLAHAFLAVAALAEHTQPPAAPGYVLLTCNEVQHLVAALVLPASSFDGAVLAGWGTADPQDPMPNEFIGSREHNWLLSRA